MSTGLPLRLFVTTLAAGVQDALPSLLAIDAPNAEVWATDMTFQGDGLAARGLALDDATSAVYVEGARFIRASFVCHVSCALRHYWGWLPLFFFIYQMRNAKQRLSASWFCILVLHVGHAQPSRRSRNLLILFK